MTSTAPVDRAAAVRAAMRQLVAERGFHGASMAAVAERAGVAMGTAYVHYASKDELVLAAYLEVKAELGAAAVAGVDPTDDARTRFGCIWRAAHDHLRAEPERARFLLQVDASPYGPEGHARAMAIADDPLMLEAARPDLADRLVPLPFQVLYDLALGPAVRLAADVDVEPRVLDVLVEACWRAVTSPDARASG